MHGYFMRPTPPQSGVVGGYLKTHPPMSQCVDSPYCHVPSYDRLPLRRSPHSIKVLNLLKTVQCVYDCNSVTIWDFRLQASMTACPSLQMSHLCRVWDRISFKRCRPPQYTYGGRQLPPTCGRMGDAEPRFSNLFALQLTIFLFPYKLGFVFISLLLYSKRRAFLFLSHG